MGRYRRAGRGSRGVFSGLILIAIGCAFLLERAGWLEAHTIWRYWPLIFIALGLARLAPPTNPERIGGSVMFLLMGGAFLCVTLGVWGLSWANAWSLVLVAVGAGIVVRALLGRRGGDDDASSAAVIEEHRHD